MKRSVMKVKNVSFLAYGKKVLMAGTFEVVRISDLRALLTHPKALLKARSLGARPNDDGLVEVTFEERVFPKIGANALLALCAMCSTMARGEEPQVKDFKPRTVEFLTNHDLAHVTKTRGRVMPTNDGFRAVKGLAPVPGFLA